MARRSSRNLAVALTLFSAWFCPGNLFAETAWAERPSAAPARNARAFPRVVAQLGAVADPVLSGARALTNTKKFGPAGAWVSNIATILTMQTLHVIGAKVRQAKLAGKPLDLPELGKVIITSSGELLNAWNIWMGMGASGITEMALHRQIAFTQSLISDAVSKKLLANFLASAVGTYVAWGAWGFGVQLIEEARLMLKKNDPSDADYALSQGMFSLLWGARTSARNRKVLGQLIQNMSTILATPELRNGWLDNSWRLQIANGEFATMVGSISVGVGVGTTIAPGPGTVIGSFVGLIGGMLVPQPAKDAITLALGMVRRAVDSEGLLNAKDDLYNATSRHEFDMALAKRSRLRASALTTYFEADYMLRERIQTARMENAIGRATLRIHSSNSLSKMLRDNEQLIASSTQTLQFVERRISEFYFKELKSLGSIRRSWMKEELERLGDFDSAVNWWLLGYHPDPQIESFIPAYQSDPKTFLNQFEENSKAMLTLFHHQGVKEADLLQAWREASAQSEQEEVRYEQRMEQGS
jgi:hypothetical protein